MMLNTILDEVVVGYFLHLILRASVRPNEIGMLWYEFRETKWAKDDLEVLYFPLYGVWLARSLPFQIKKEAPNPNESLRQSPRSGVSRTRFRSSFQACTLMHNAMNPPEFSPAVPCNNITEFYISIDSHVSSSLLEQHKIMIASQTNPRFRSLVQEGG